MIIHGGKEEYTKKGNKGCREEGAGKEVFKEMLNYLTMKDFVNIQKVND